MNFLQVTIQILEKEVRGPAKVLELCNLLVPKIMSIPLADTRTIQNHLIHLQTNFTLSEPSWYRLQIIIAFLDYRNSDYEGAIERLYYAETNQAPFLSAGDQATTCVVIGACNRSLGKREQALEHLQFGIERLATDPLPLYQQYCCGIALYHVAEMYGELKDYEEMLNKQFVFKERLEKWENPVAFQNRNLNGIGRAYFGMQQYEEALRYLERAGNLLKEGANLPFQARNLHDMGFVYTKMERYEEALDYYGQALKIRKEQNYYNASVTTMTEIGRLYVLQGNTGAAIRYLTEALTEAKRLNVKIKAYKVCELLAKTYEADGDFESALVYHKEFHTLKEEVENVRNTQVENQRVREHNTKLRKQKELIEAQKQQIESTLKKLKETNKYLENFASVAAHDMKAPIRVASSFAGILERKFKNTWEEDDLVAFRFISSNIGRLAKMIDDLLSLSKLDQNLPMPKVVNTADIARDVETTLSQKIAQKEVQLAINKGLPLVMGHQSLLTQLFQNIIDNAVKHSAKDNVGMVVVSAREADYSSDFYQFEIRDNGEGIPERMQPFIFELFNGMHRKDSTGIGLATCKKIVNHYGGKIWIRSKKGLGTSVFFTLPKA